MAHFAELNDDNVVMQVIVISNEELLLDGVESETKGIEFCKSLFGENTKWVQTSYNRNFRKNCAFPGGKYDPENDYFYNPTAPYSSWIFNVDNGEWEAPTPYPSGDGMYQWVEDDLNWQLVESGA
jgi:hypothetical protein